jgi:predicted Zn-dependent protease
MFVPTTWDQKVGKEAFQDLQDFFELTTEPALTNRVHLVAQRLKKGLPPDAPKFKFHVAKTIIVNAVALPGGDVVVMHPLLYKATPEELAGVMAHEMAHVIHRHAMRQLAQEVGPAFISKMIFGGDSALAALVEGSSQLGQLHYSRRAERQADDTAFDILVNANIDPRGLTSFFEKLRHMERFGGGEASVFSTHPATADRILHLQKRWEKLPKKTGFQPVPAGPPLPREYDFGIDFNLPLPLPF